jgi:hypothetical protein
MYYYTSQQSLMNGLRSATWQLLFGFRSRYCATHVSRLGQLGLDGLDLKNYHTNTVSVSPNEFESYILRRSVLVRSPVRAFAMLLAFLATARSWPLDLLRAGLGLLVTLARAAGLAVLALAALALAASTARIHTVVVQRNTKTKSA